MMNKAAIMYLRSFESPQLRLVVRLKQSDKSLWWKVIILANGGNQENVSLSPYICLYSTMDKQATKRLTLTSSKNFEEKRVANLNRPSFFCACSMRFATLYRLFHKTETAKNDNHGDTMDNECKPSMPVRANKTCG